MSRRDDKPGSPSRAADRRRRLRVARQVERDVRRILRELARVVREAFDAAAGGGPR